MSIPVVSFHKPVISFKSNTETPANSYKGEVQDALRIIADSDNQQDLSVNTGRDILMAASRAAQEEYNKKRNIKYLHKSQILEDLAKNTDSCKKIGEAVKLEVWHAYKPQTQ